MILRALGQATGRGALALLVGAGMSVAAPAAARGDDAPSNAEIARGMLQELLAPVATAVRDSGAPLSIALHPRTSSATADALTQAMGSWFLKAGFRVFLPTETDSLPEGPLEFDFQIDRSSFEYPHRRRAFLSLGAPQLLRRARLGLTGRVQRPSTGEWIWEGSPELRREDWISQKEAGPLAAGTPAWMSNGRIPTKTVVAAASNAVTATASANAANASPDLTGSGWKERFLVAGLLGGVLILYFSGAQ